MLLRSLPGLLAMPLTLLAAAMANAQQPAQGPCCRNLEYGPPLSLDNAKKVAAGAAGEAQKNKWTMVVAIVDPNGTLIYYEKMDNTQNGSATVAIDKARSAALFKRPTKDFEDLIAAGGDGLRYFKLEGAIPIEGGIPLVIENKIVGAIGVSGGRSFEDVQCAQAGVNALK